MALQTLHGSCHCGKVTFEFDTEPTYTVECNCSICVKKGIMIHRVPRENFRLLSGEEHLRMYQFNTGTARHFFCTTCGIHPFVHPRSAPDTVTVVNFRCLDDFDPAAEDLERRHFDGLHYEEAVKTIR